MPSTPNLLRGFVLTCMMLAPSGCISLGRDAKPDFPPAIDPHIYEARITETMRLASGDQPAISIAGARIADGGIYVDLIVVNLPKIDGFDPRDDRGLYLGDSISDLQNPGQLIEIIDPSGRTVGLRPVQRPRMGGFIMPGTCILFARSPSYRLEFKGEIAFVDVCMWRTDHALKPGEYRMRLLPTDSPRDDRIARIGQYYIHDSEWQLFAVEHAPSNDT